MMERRSSVAQTQLRDHLDQERPSKKNSIQKLVAQNVGNLERWNETDEPEKVLFDKFRLSV